ncbi:hypothetical protein CONPUDRAFT_77955 [Coniophora puteana RWD-64-598 SS2]|uniref:Ribonuclease H1 N-terminal domain-containing protein n=1 Tax=Coniophora puteana (strain RWD-64-598) TaxID=741705 RepID=R7SEV0_CONPW|nr:uncharacterized protein CONPUDRAFT_77955 [Coniophora puteana RWD-64-598 SS2]EIW74686.1 hypothetical protein CONPUDRAFT_77955 [Coniophora puteana RWD-64-598 SS2]
MSNQNALKTFIVHGDKKERGLMRRRPFLAAGKRFPALPFAIYYREDRFLPALQRINQFIDGILEQKDHWTDVTHLNSHPLRLARWLSRRINKLPADWFPEWQDFYPVTLGRNIGIYLDWDDCAETVNGREWRRFEHVDSIGDAMVFMITKGQYTTMEGVLKTSDAMPAARTPRLLATPLPRSLATPLPSSLVPSTPRTPAAPAPPTPRSSVPSTSGVSVVSLRADIPVPSLVPNFPGALVHPQRPATAFPPAPAPPIPAAARQPRASDDLDASLANLHVSSSASSTTSSPTSSTTLSTTSSLSSGPAPVFGTLLQMPTTAEEPILYSHVRTLRGIVGHVMFPEELPVDGYPPSGLLAPAAEEYLLAHGYDAASVWGIHHAFRARSLPSFMEFVCRRGLPQLEAMVITELRPTLTFIKRCLFFFFFSVADVRLLFPMPSAATPVTGDRYIKGYQPSIRRPHRHRAPHKKIERTPADKAAEKERRAENSARYKDMLSAAQDAVWEHAVELQAAFPNHSTEHYFEAIMQMPKYRQQELKSVSKWNAYVFVETEKYNEALPSGQPRAKATEYQKTLAPIWRDMPLEERDLAVGDRVQVLTEKRANKATGTHSIAIAACHDASKTLDMLASEFSKLAPRCGVRGIIVAVRSDADHLNKPMTYATDEQTLEYFEVITKSNLTTFGRRLEACHVSGLVNNYRQTLLLLKKDIASYIHGKLIDAAECPVPRMYYVNFDTLVTAKYGVLILNWPLRQLQCPSDINTTAELQVLINSWKNGTTKFYKMTPAEWAEWEEKRFESRMAEMEDAPEQVSEPVAGVEQAPVPSDSQEATMITQRNNQPAPQSAAPAEVFTVRQFMPATTPNAGISGVGSSDNFMNAVIGPNNVLITTKQRKPRKDKGTKRGSKTAATLSLLDGLGMRLLAHAVTSVTRSAGYEKRGAKHPRGLCMLRSAKEQEKALYSRLRLATNQAPEYTCPHNKREGKGGWRDHTGRGRGQWVDNRGMTEDLKWPTKRREAKGKWDEGRMAVPSDCLGGWQQRAWLQGSREAVRRGAGHGGDKEREA